MNNKMISASFLLLLMVTSSVLAVSLNIEPAQSTTASYKLSGYVYDSTGNLARLAHVYLIDQINGRQTAQSYSDLSGYYTLSVSAGTYNLVSRLIGSSQSYSENNLAINSDISMDIRLVVGYRISGRVFDSSGNILPGASTNVSNSTWTVPGVTSDGSGYYTIYAPAGTYVFGLWPPINSNLINFKNNNLTVTSDMTYDVVMSSGYKVSGYIKYPSGDKIYGATTYLVNGSGYSFSSGRYTDALSLSGGYYVVAPAGNYTIKAQLNSVLIYSEANVTFSEDISKDLTLPSVSISPSTAVIDVGQSYPYTATPIGGSGAYSNFTWYVNGTAKATTDNPTFYFSPNAVGTYSITAKVTYTSGVVSTESAAVTATANPTLVPCEVSASPEVLDQGQTAVLTAAEASAGTGSYSYQWYSKAPSAQDYSSIAGATSLSYAFTTTASTELGKWSFGVNATDSASNPNTVVSNICQIRVNPPPAVTVTPELAILDKDTSKTFTALPGGGTGSLTYEWYLDNVKVGQNSTSYSYTATQGTHTLHVKVTDSATPPLSATSSPVAITVNPPPTAPTACALNSTIDQGQAFNLTSTAIVNGTAPYKYQWFAKSPNGTFSALVGATSSNCSIPTLSNITSGVWYFVLHVTDSATVPATVTSNVILVTVNAAPSVSVSASSATLTVGQSCTFTTNTANGSGTYTRYQWYLNGAVQAGQNSAAFTFSPSAAGSYSVTATVTDSLDVTSAQSNAVTVQVSPTPTPTPTPTPAPTSTPSSSPSATQTPTSPTPTPTPTTTATPTASPSSPSPTPTQNVTQGPDTGTYLIIVVVLAIIVVSLFTVILLSKKMQKTTKK